MMKRALDAKPWERRFMLDIFRPSEVVGPVLFCEFSRLAMIWAGVAI